MRPPLRLDKRHPCGSKLHQQLQCHDLFAVFRVPSVARIVCLYQTRLGLRASKFREYLLGQGRLRAAQPASLARFVGHVQLSPSPQTVTPESTSPWVPWRPKLATRRGHRHPAYWGLAHGAFPRIRRREPSSHPSRLQRPPSHCDLAICSVHRRRTASLCRRSQPASCRRPGRARSGARSQPGYGKVSTNTTRMGRSDTRRYSWI
jgi:hypothetical protein